ncbi:PREDICTED: protein RST1 [Nelumbo nucifera]|uniref:Protein RST1 n=2 Tax=Nelumbo nucifera TaxID=4432 RepID=A0A1U7ZL59_NELNU|nr:PREDICTED: protein RST1 [Nelumbo nucifera]DAD30838.1 TPA_asm: hypothetical protein HUJ06_009689 [Nelumbo nucifera]
MNSYTLLLEKIRVPQPSLQKFAVISIFEKLRSAPSHLDVNSDSGRDAISQCLHSNSTSVVDQSIRELCRLVRDGKIEVSRGLLELQSALEGCNSRFVDIFVKGIGFLVRFSFEKSELSWRSDSPETHPFVKVLSCRTEVHTELVQQVLLFIVQNKRLGVAEVCKFLGPFLNFSVLRIPFSDSSSLFTRQLILSVASLSCSFPSEAVPVVKLLTGCLKFFPRNNAEDLKTILYVAKYLVDSFTVVLIQLVEINLKVNEAQLCALEMLETLLQLCSDYCNCFGGIEPIMELSNCLFIVQKELGLRYLPEFSSVILSLFVIITWAEFEHEQLAVLKLSILLLKWKNEHEHLVGESGLTEELLFIFPLINLASSPSKSVRVAATDFLFLLEKFVVDLLVMPRKQPITNIESKSTSKLETIIYRLLQRLWFQDQPSLSSSYFLSFASIAKTNIKVIDSQPKSWLSQLREYSLLTVERQKSPLNSQTEENILTEMPLVLGSVVAVLVIHHSLGNAAIDSLAALGVMEPKLSVSLLLAILFYNKVFCNNKSDFHSMSLKLLGMLPSLASHSMMIPLVIQTLLPMLQKDARPVLYATATRLLCKTWEVTDRVFGTLQGILHPKDFIEFSSDKNISISMAASICDICRKNPDRGVDLILSVSACIESRDPTIQALGFQSLAHLCETDVVDFYTAWDVVAKHVLDYMEDPIVANGLCILLRWGAMDVEAYSEASRSVLQILWEVGNLRQAGYRWIKARVSAFESLAYYEVDYIQKNIPDFKKRNVELLISEDNPDVLQAMEGFEVKIMTFEHITRRRLLKEKRSTGNKIEKLLDVIPQVVFTKGQTSKNVNELAGAALLCLSFTPKNLHNLGMSKELLDLHAMHEDVLLEAAESLQLSRNILLALLSLQSWKPFMQRWMRAVVMFIDAKAPSSVLDKTSKAANDIFKILCRIAEESIPRSAENMALAMGALCVVLPPSAHAVASSASKFLLKWLLQYEHEHRQWAAAIALGFVSIGLHATDYKQKFQIISGLLKVLSDSKSILVNGACGVGLGFICQDLPTGDEAADDFNLVEETDQMKEANLLGKIVRTLALKICQFIPSSSYSLQSLCDYFPVDIDHQDGCGTSELSYNNSNNMGEDVWGVAGLILGLGNSVSTIYRYGAHDALLKIKALITSWIPFVNPGLQNPCGGNEKPEISLSVGSCLALPIVVAFFRRVELIDDGELDHLVNGYRELISELLSVKKSGNFHPSLLMASCLGAGSLLSSILSEGSHPIKAEDVKSLMELFRRCYTNPYPSTIHLGGMLGVVNALGAGAGIPTGVYSWPSNLQAAHEQKDSPYIRGPILSCPVCEPLSTSYMQELFLVAQDSKDQQLRRHAAWALSFLRHQWWSKEFQAVKDSPQSNLNDHMPVSQSFSEDSTVLKLSMWLLDLDCSGMGAITDVNTVAAVLRYLSRAPRLPSVDWGSIIRRCMRYEDQISGKLSTGQAVKKGNLRQECIQFSLAHANQLSSLLFFLDELSDLPRFRTLELNLQSFLLRHLADLIKIFSGSRLEKLFDHMADYICSPTSSYQVYNPAQKSYLRVSLWEGLNLCLDEASTESAEYLTNMEKCMGLLFAFLPVMHFDANLDPDQANSHKEWLEAVRCLRKARHGYLMSLLEVPEVGLVQGRQLAETIKRIQARARLFMIGSVPFTELAKLKAYILNTESAGIWNVLVEVVSTLQHADGGIKRQWLVDAVDISCITNYPSTALQFIGLLSSSCCKYMPLLVLDPVAVVSDLPITLPSLLSESSWKEVAESVVLSLWTSTERIYGWASHLASGDDNFSLQGIDKSENVNGLFLSRIMYHVCVSLKHYLPLEKQLRLANLFF